MDITQIIRLPQSQLRSMPAMKPPAGVTPDFNNPGRDGSNATQTIIGLATLTGLTVIILIARLYTKFVVLKKHGWEDYTATLATIGAVSYASLNIYVFDHGFGVHQWNVSMWTMLHLTKWMNAILYSYKPWMLLAKLSICLFFLRVFGSSRNMRYAIYFAIAYNVVLQCCAFFLSIFLCLPGRPEFWQCSGKISTLNISTAGFNIFADFYLLILPFFSLWRLQMGARQKIALFLVFMAGALACISSILGLIYRLKQDSSPDVAWNFAPEIVLVTFELEATIMVGCFMVLPGLFRSKYPLSFSAMWSNRSHIFKPISWVGSRTQLNRDNSNSSKEVVAKPSTESEKSPFGKVTPYRGTDPYDNV